jgi:hypothetical protein
MPAGIKQMSTATAETAARAAAAAAASVRLAGAGGHWGAACVVQAAAQASSAAVANSLEGCITELRQLARLSSWQRCALVQCMHSSRV